LHQSLPKIDYFIEIDAAKEKVWQIISDLDNEYEYWYGTKDVRNISKEGNVINREITQNFRNHKILQKAILHPTDSVEIEYLKGLTEGKKTISIESLAQNRQKVRVLWDVHFTGIFWLLTPWLGRHTEKGTIGALDRMKTAAESNADEKNSVQ
jgi:hypothetical protein